MVKNIGKPCAGKSHARFDEGRLMNEPSLLIRSSRVRRGVPKLWTAMGISFLLYPELGDHVVAVNAANRTSLLVRKHSLRRIPGALRLRE